MQIPTPDGGRLWAERSGAGEPLVLISGMNQSHLGLAGQFPLREHFSLICMDNRGTGESSDWERGDEDGPYIGDFAEDVITVLDHFEIKRAHVVGFSMGGRIAQWVAIRFPRRVGGLVLISTSPGESHGFKRPDEVDNLYTSGTPLQMSRLMFNSEWTRSHHEEFQAILACTTERGAQRALHARATHLHDSWNALPKIKAPTLVMHGTEDQINPVENSQLLVERIPGAELNLIHGGRHAIASEYADAVNGEIIDFLQAHPIATLGT